MTAEKYVKEVSKLLKCRTAKKKAIRDKLLSDINSAVASGERLEDVFAKMGIPWDYANRYNDNFDKAEKAAARREKTIKISEMPFGQKFEDYPEDTVFVWDEDDEDDWEKEIEDED